MAIQHFIQQFDDMVNKLDCHVGEEIFVPQFIAHVPFMPRLNRSSYRAYMQGFRITFPDFCQEINDSFVANSRLVLRVSYRGTHKRDFLGIPATYREITMSGISIFQIENDLVVENWTELDIFGVIQQMSVVNLMSSLS
ncbi:MAG: ester cyclase [Anaerolineae bacterium]|nr:ester cyclase [Anaerolineae bacterium]